jgi:hypothetical protein
VSSQTLQLFLPLSDNKSMTQTSRFCLWISLGCVAIHQSAPAQAANPDHEAWVSLYNGQELSFSDSDRARLLRALNALGVEHHSDTRQHILVSPELRPVVQDLVSKVLSSPNG